jgi:hypothetical protein
MNLCLKRSRRTWIITHHERKLDRLLYTTRKRHYLGSITLDMEVSNIYYAKNANHAHTTANAYHWGFFFRNKTSLNLASPSTVGGRRWIYWGLWDAKEAKSVTSLGFIRFKGQNWWSTVWQSNSTPHDIFFRISVAIVFLFHDIVCFHVLVVVTLESVVYDVTKSSNSVLQVVWHWRQLNPRAAWFKQT